MTKSRIKAAFIGLLIFFCAGLLTYVFFPDHFMKKTPFRARQVFLDWTDKSGETEQNKDILDGQGGNFMVVKVIELVGSSPHNWTEAVNNAITEANQTVDEITGVEATNFTAKIDRGKISEYKADVRIAFQVH